MRDAAPPGGDLPRLTQSAVACLASVLELDPAEVPQPKDHPDPWGVWRDWLARRGLGLLPIAEPRVLSWAGPWLALLRDGRMAVAYGGPPGIAYDPLGDGATIEDVEAGFLVAPHDVALWSPPPAPAVATGRVEAIAVAPAAEAPVALVEQAVAHAGRGLEGDRYAAGAGTFTRTHGRGHSLTLIAAEVLDELGLTAEDARRNVVVRGIDLEGLIGHRFRIGEVEVQGERRCEPCAHLDRLAPGTLRALVRRGGLRADLLTGGVIRVGDPVIPAP
jgi:hypothetical protein